MQYADDFDGYADGSLATVSGGVWTNVGGTNNVSSGAVVGGSEATSLVTAECDGVDQFAEIEWNQGGGTYGPLVCSDGSGYQSGYAFGQQNWGDWVWIYRNGATLVSSSTAWANVPAGMARMRIEVLDNGDGTATINCYAKAASDPSPWGPDNLRITTTDPDPLTGTQVGFSNSYNSTYDNFSGGDISGSGPQALALPAIAATSTLAAPTLTPGAVTVDAPHIAATTTLHAPTVAADAVTLDVPTIASSTELHTPALAPGAVELAPPAIAASTALHAPTVTPGPATITAPTIPAATTLAAPTVTPGPVTVVVAHISAVTVLHPPSLTDVIQVPTIPADTVLHAPTIEPGPVTVTLPTIIAATVLYAMTVRHAVDWAITGPLTLTRLDEPRTTSPIDQARTVTRLDLARTTEAP